MANLGVGFMVVWHLRPEYRCGAYFVNLAWSRRISGVVLAFFFVVFVSFVVKSGPLLPGTAGLQARFAWPTTRAREHAQGDRTPSPEGLTCQRA